MVCSSPAASSEWNPLFDGKSLQGWKPNENPSTFRVEDGVIVADGSRSHLFYVGAGPDQPFKNFELKAEVKAAPGANSGIYFHTEFQPTDFPAKGFEVQVNNSARPQGSYQEMKKTGSLYGLRNLYRQLVPDNTWFTLHIKVEGKRVQVNLNDLPVVDYTEPDDITPLPNQPGRRLGSGTFALQGHDPQSKVWFRNLMVRRLPDALPQQPTPTWDALDRQIAELGAANYPLVDFHTHLKGGLTMEEVLAHTRATGINHGVAVNCGIGFGVTNDAGIRAFLESVKGQPVFLGMQAEGREWPTLFSRQAIASFDYVFSDAMTIIDHRGRRARLWIKQEVDIPDKQVFMDHLVDTIVGIMDKEPIDIYVNPTFLPDVIASEYDSLWTPERQSKVIAAVVRNGVAVEINSRYQLPKAGFIKAAKAAGVKFTLGTNNGDRDIGRDEYGLRMISECGLGWQDFWMPKPEGRKPVQVRRSKN
jgi:hypothetical protein